MRIVLCTAALLLASPALADTVYASFDPTPKVVNLGDTFTIDIVADMTSDIVGWGLDLTIADPSVAMRTAADPVIGPDWDPAFAPDGDGLAGLAFPAGVSGNDILLATVEFQAMALGVTDLYLSITPGDLTEGFALYPTGFDDAVFTAGQIRVIPEPAALALLGLGVLALRRR
jgi:hypothetical protein